MVTTTYGHGYVNDMNNAAEWGAEQLTGMAAGDASLECLNGDVIMLTGVMDGAGADVDEYFYHDINITDIPSDTYTHYVVRWRTSVASAGLGARVQLVFTAGAQELLNATGIPQFSSSANRWMVTTGTVASGKVIDHVRIYADDYPNTAPDATNYVYYDFILLCQGTFTLPNTVYGMHWTPGGRDTYLEVPGRNTDITQRMGSRGATCTVGCDLDRDTWTATGYAAYPGELFDYIDHRSFYEPFQWVTGLKGRSMKATIHPSFTYDMGSAGTSSRLDLEFREYSLGCKGSEAHYERWNIT